MLDDLQVKCIPFGEENDFDVRNRWSNANEFLSFSETFQLPKNSRETLAQVVEEQNPELPASIIIALRKSKTFTITTGHQLSFLGGPLFFYLKIAEIIALAKSINSNLNGEAKVLPVFWMATEDHDLEEIFEPSYKGKEIQFNSLPTDLQSGHWTWEGKEWEAFKAYADAVNLPKNWRSLLSKGDSQADFTRKIVRYFFPGEELIILDPNNYRLKELAHDLFIQDLNGLTYSAFQDSKKRTLEAGMKLQIQAQAINSFGLIDNFRHKIDRFEKGVLSLSNGDQLNVSDLNPGFWSPNVVLRPVFQQIILPNILYVGGGAEVKYWGQLKEVFAAYKMPFPMVKQRLSFGQMASEDYTLWEQLGLESAYLLKKWEQVELHFVAIKSQSSLADLNQLMDALKTTTKAGLAQVLGKSNPAFQAGEEKRLEQFEERMKRKIRKNAREKWAKELMEVKRVYDSLRVEGVLQERRCHPLDFNYANIPWSQVFSLANSGFVLQLI